MRKILQYFSANARHLMFQGFTALAPGVEQSSRLNSLYHSGSLADYVNKLFMFAITIGAILAIVRIIYAGYKYMGSDMWAKKSDAKTIIGDAVLGLLLLLAIFIILYQINPNILKLDFLNTIKQVPSSQQTPVPEAAPGQFGT